jgi:hypothetical protein
MNFQNGGLPKHIHTYCLETAVLAGVGSYFKVPGFNTVALTSLLFITDFLCCWNFGSCFICKGLWDKYGIPKAFTENN